MDDSTKLPSELAGGTPDPVNPDDATAPAAPEDAGDNQPVRKSFRVPLDEPYALTVHVGEESFGAFDLVEGGVGIFHSQRAVFSVGQPLVDMQLHFRGQVLAVQGRVVHVLRDDRGMIRYGVEFQDMDDETRQQVVEFVRFARNEYLNHQDQNADEE